MSLQESIALTYNNVTVASCNVTRKDKRILGYESCLTAVNYFEYFFLDLGQK